MSYYLRPNFRFYPREIMDITAALIILISAFSVLMGGFKDFILFLPVSSLAVLTGFFLHEMSHKYIAFRYGYPAAFKAWYTGLFIALISSFFGFIFAAPGAVIVYGMPSKRENGVISAAGPSMNLILGFILIAFVFIFPSLASIFLYVSYFNFFLAFFNLLPIPPMDGTKIITWNIPLYIILLIGSLSGIAFFYMI